MSAPEHRVLERRVSARGPRFWIEEQEELWVFGTLWARHGGKVMFCFAYDASSRDGPRVATEADCEAHPEAWAALAGGADQVPPLTIVKVTDSGQRPEPAPKPHADRRGRAYAGGARA